MDDLDRSPLLDKRYIAYIRSLVQGTPKKPAFAMEQKFYVNAAVLSQINIELRDDGGLSDLLQKFSQFFAVQDIALFFIEAFKEEMLREALDLVEGCYNIQRAAELPQLLEMLEQTKEMPASWVVAINSEEKDERNPAVTPSLNKSGLNLEAMKNFK